MMTRKNYQAMADILRPEVEKAFFFAAAPNKPLLRNIANEMADVFAADNPRFDRSKFLAACGF